MSATKNITISPKILLQRIKTEFPEVACNLYQYIDEGWDHAVLIVDNKLVFRFPLDDEYAQLLHTEIAVLKRLKPFANIRIPNYTHIAPDVSFAGYPLIPGKPLMLEIFKTLSTSDQTSLAMQLAGFLSTIHTLMAQGHDFSDVVLSDMKQWQNDVKTATEKHLKSKLSQKDLDCVYEISAKVDKIIAQSLPTTFIHGDVYNRHLLWDAKDKKLGLIDFSDMNRGDPAFDFGELYEYGSWFVDQVYAHYTGPKDSTFLARAWVYQQWAGLFMMADYFESRKTTFAVARETFDRVKNNQIPS